MDTAFMNSGNSKTSDHHRLTQSSRENKLKQKR